MEEEIWREVPGYEGRYWVSDFGRIKNRRGFSYLFNKRGYVGVKLHLKGKKRNFFVHRIVMMSFIGGSHLQVNHKNGIKTDNRLINLEYVTQEENFRHYMECLYDKEKHVNKIRGNSTSRMGVPLLKNRKPFILYENEKYVSEFSCLKDAAGCGYSKYKIVSWLTGRVKKYRGYTFIHKIYLISETNGGGDA